MRILPFTFTFHRQTCFHQSNGEEKQPCLYFLLSADLASTGQGHLTGNLLYHDLRASFYVNDAECLAFTHLCLVDTSDVTELAEVVINSNKCIKVVSNQSESSFFNASDSQSLCWDIDSGSACLKKEQRSVLDDNAIIRFCESDNNEIKPYEVSWIPKASRKLFSGRDSELLVNFTVANIKQNVILHNDTFSIQILLADDAHTKYASVSETINLHGRSGVTTISVSSLIPVEVLSIGDSLKFTSIPVSLPSFSAGVCSQITHIGITAFTEGNDFENPGGSKISWVKVYPDLLECDCDEIDLIFTKFYTHQYFAYVGDLLQSFHAVIKYSFKGPAINFWTSNSIESVLTVEMMSSAQYNASSYWVSKVEIVYSELYDEQVLSDQTIENCQISSGSLFVEGRLHIASAKNLPKKDMVHGKYILKATVNEQNSENEVDGSNNVALNEIVILRQQFDKLQLLSVSTVFSMEKDNVYKVDAYILVQYTGTAAISLLAGADFLEIDAFFGDVEVTDAFAKEIPPNVLKLNKETECGMPRISKDGSSVVKPGELMELHKSFYASVNDVAELSCNGYDQVIVTALISSEYHIAETNLANNVLQDSTVEIENRCQDLLPIVRKRMRDIHVIPLSLSIDMPHLEPYLVADGAYQNDFLLALLAQVAGSAEAELKELYFGAVTEKNSLIVTVTLLLSEHLCLTPPCLKVELTKISFEFDVNDLLSRQPGLEKTISFQSHIQSNLKCGWNDLSWKLDLKLTDETVIAFEQTDSGCPMKQYKVFLLCPTGSLAVSSFVQDYPPVSRLSNDFSLPKFVKSILRVYDFKLSGIVTGTEELSIMLGYEASLCQFSQCTETERDDGIKVNLLEQSIMKNSYPSYSMASAGLPGYSELVKIEGKIELDLRDYRKQLPMAISVPLFVKKESSVYIFFGNLTLSPFCFFKSNVPAGHGFQVNHFSFFGSTTIERKVSGEFYAVK